MFNQLKSIRKQIRNHFFAIGEQKRHMCPDNVYHMGTNKRRWNLFSDWVDKRINSFEWERGQNFHTTTLVVQGVVFKFKILDSFVLSTKIDWFTGIKNRSNEQNQRIGSKMKVN